MKKNTSQTKYRRFCLRYRCAVCVCVFAGIERLTLRLGPSMGPHGTTWDRMGPNFFSVGPHFISVGPSWDRASRRFFFSSARKRKKEKEKEKKTAIAEEKPPGLCFPG